MSYGEFNRVFHKGEVLDSCMVPLKCNLIGSRKYSNSIRPGLKKEHIRYLSQFANYTKIPEILSNKPPACLGIANFQSFKFLTSQKVTKGSRRRCLMKPLVRNHLISTSSQKRQLANVSNNSSISIHERDFSLEIRDSIDLKNYENITEDFYENPPKRKTILSKLSNKSYFTVRSSVD